MTTEARTPLEIRLCDRGRTKAHAYEESGRDTPCRPFLVGVRNFILRPVSEHHPASAKGNEVLERGSSRASFDKCGAKRRSHPILRGGV